MATLLRILLSLAVALAAPRLRGLVLTLFSLALLLGAAGFAIASSSMSIALFAMLAFAGILSALLLPRLVPRLFIALFSLVALPLGPIAARGKFGIAAAIAGALAALFFSVRKPQLMMRLSCAGAGALVASDLLPEKHALVWRLLALLFLFALQELVRRFVSPERERAPLRVKTMVRSGAALGAAGTLFVLALPFLANPLSTPIASDHPELPPLPFPERRALLEARAPHGGLVWPLPSEAIFWDEPNLIRALFPRFDNLDALFLGTRTEGLAALPGTSFLGRISLHKPIADARLVHDDAAVARLRFAAQAIVAALHDILPLVKPGTREAELEAALKIAMRAHGCGPESFPLIFASGASAAEPHGSGNLGVLKEGDLLVADIGCTVDHYASDFTRTLPISGTFTARQKLLYENVLAAQEAALAQCKPGAQLSPMGPGDSMENTARDILKSRAPDREAHMPHGLGHTVGLFVHDIYLSGPLEPGNVITIEPGTYLPGELGIRIEDTFLVTPRGCDRLTEGFPAETAAIEQAMSGARPR